MKRLILNFCFKMFRTTVARFLQLTNLRLEFLGSFAEALYHLGRVLGRLVGSQLGTNLLHDLIFETKFLAMLSLKVALYLVQLVGAVSFLNVDPLQRVLRLTKDSCERRVLLFQRFVFRLHTTNKRVNELVLLPPFYSPLSGTTQVNPYQKKHSPIHNHRDHQPSFIRFLHLLQSISSSLFSLPT